MVESINGRQLPLQGIQKPQTEAIKKKEGKTDGSFAQMLQEVQEKDRLNFSSHAARRIKNREINLNESDLQRMEKAVDQLEKKGGRESLLLHRDVAYLVSVDQKTVITAVEGRHTGDRIFTNIDSAVIIED